VRSLARYASERIQVKIGFMNCCYKPNLHPNFSSTSQAIHEGINTHAAPEKGGYKDWMFRIES
jgi:hypothetical protein